MDVQVHIPTEDSYPGMAEALLQQAPEQFAVLGTSMGGRLALEVALAAPKRVEALCIIGSGAGAVADPAGGLKRSARIRSGERDQVIEEMALIISHLPGPKGKEAQKAFDGMGKAFDLEMLARQSDALAKREDRWAAAAKIACPVLCLWGEHDQFSPAADGRKLAATVKNGHYVELRDCGHFPTLEYPEESTQALKDWLTASDLI